MPEGDVIHRTAARLNAALAERQIVAASSPNPRAGLASAAAGLVGGRVEVVQARGKHLLIRFAGGAVVHNHLGMHGRWRVNEGGVPPARARAPLPWLTLETEDACAVQTGGSRLRIITEAAARRDPQLAGLGPDVVDPAFEVAAGVSALRSSAPGTKVGEALLDQSLLSGIGNIWRCEGCFAARVSPWQAVDALPDDQLHAVVRATTRLIGASAAGRRPVMQVYRRAGRPCPRCATRIASRSQGDSARLTYWCSECQS